MKYWKDMNEEELEELRKKTEEFEAGFPDGVYAIPPKKGEPKIKVHELIKYCKKHNKKPNELTEKELEQFYDGFY